MALTHYKWEKSGRTLKTGLPNQFVYKSGIGQANVDLGSDNFAPYMWDAQNKILKFATCEIHLEVDGIQVYLDGKKGVKFGLHPEIKGTDWERKAATVSGLLVSEVITDNNTDIAEIEYEIETEDQKTKVKLKAGGFHQLELEFEIEAKIESEQRLLLETDSLVEAFEIISYYDPAKNKLGKTIGVSLGKSKFFWEYHEADDHKSLDLNSGIKTQIAIAEGYYTVAAIKKISPTTWGPTSIANTNDDGSEINETSMDLDGYDTDGNATGRTGGADNRDSCWRWDNVTVSGTIENGSKLTLDVAWKSGGNFECNIFGIEESDPADWSSGTRPSQRTKTTANTAWTVTATGVQDSPEIKTAIQEILDDGGHSSGNAVAFVINGNDSSLTWQAEDYETGGTKATVTIVYTAVGGNAPTGALYGPLVGPMGGPV